MKKVIFSLALLLTCSLLGYAQKGISYQAVILDPKPIEIPGQDITGQPFVNGAVSLKFKLFSSTFVQEFEEVHAAKTDAYGLVNVLIGSQNASAFSALVWDNNPRSMQVWVSFDQGGTYTKVSEQVLTYSPYALYAETTGTAGKLSGTLTIAEGGTGAKTAANARTNLGLGNVDNTSDANKPVSIATQNALDAKVNELTTYVNNQVAAATIPDADAANKGKIQLAGDLGGTAASPTVPGLALKANAADVTNSLALKADAATVNAALNLKANAADVTNELALKANAAETRTLLREKEIVDNKSINVLADAASDSKYPTVKSIKTYVDTQVAAATIADADASTKGKIQLAGDLAGTAAAPTVPGLALKANTVDMAASLARKANAVDVTASLALKADAADVTTALNTKASTSDLTSGLALKANTADVTTALNTKASTSDLTSGLALKANTADMTAALDLKAPLASPTFTGTVTTAAINTGALSSTAVTAPTYASAPRTLTYSGSTINWNPALGLNAAITLTQNSTLSFTAAPPVGSYGTVVLTQDGTGGRTLTLPTLPGATNQVLGSTSTSTVALSTAASSKDILNFYYDGTVVYWNIGQGYGAASTTNSGPTNLASGVTGTLAVGNGGTGATSLSGLVKGNGTGAMTAAVAGTDYQAPLTLTTTGSGAASLSGTTLNIPSTTNYALPTASASTLGGVKVGTNLSIDGSGVLSADVSATTISGTLAVGKGGTGATTLTGYVKGTGTTAMTASAIIPVADVTGAAPLASPTFTGAVTAPIYASAPQALADGTTISWDPSLGLNASVTLGGNRTLSFTSTPTAGAYGTLVVTQDGTGSRTLTLPSTTNKVLGSTSTTTIALSTTAGAKDIVNFYYDGTNCYWNVGQGYGSAATAATTNLASSVTGTLPVANGGTGAATLTGYVKGAGTATMTASATIPVADISGTLPVANGGTGAATLTGLVKGNGTGAMTAATAGTDYLAPTGSAASLTNFPTLNQNTTGNAANVTGIVAVANGGTGSTNGSITGTTALSFVAGGSNQNVSILPSGTGSVGIGTNSPNSSAILDASSTTKGFLPPRMTHAQKTAIASPPQGLMIYCTNCGTNGEPEYYNGVAWVNMAGGTAASVPPPPLGSTYEGGKVFYIFQPGDLGYVAGETHGLIAAPSDIPSNAYRILVGCYGNYGTSTALGTGAANTTKLLACNDAVNAAKLVDALTDGGYSDWYLPSKDELNKLYEKRDLVGNFTDWIGWYWSSSEFYLAPESHAWFQRFSDGSQDGEGKGYQKGIRAIRSF